MRNGLDLEQTGYRSVDELGDPLDRQDGAHAHQLVAGDADLVSCLHGRVGVADLAGVGAVGQPEEEPEAHDVEPIDAAIPGLTGEELAHYGWLIGGLLDGAFALASSQCCICERPIVKATDGAHRFHMDDVTGEARSWHVACEVEQGWPGTVACG